jgi:fido (protein-threonine AMPylation protein)
MSELIFASSNPQEAYRTSKLLQEKKIRKIAPRIYTNNFDESPSDIVRRNILEILGKLYSGAVLSHRSSFEFKPTSTHQIFVTYSYTKKIRLPGVTINFLQGKSPIEGDNEFVPGLFVSSKERAFLENCQITKKSGPDSKTLSLPQVEEKLDDILLVHGENGLNDLRDKARKVSEMLDMKNEFETLNKIIGALLTTKPARVLKSDLAISRAAGFPYDRKRIVTFEKLFNFLHNSQFKDRPEKNNSVGSFRNFAFFEAYFSNYIEGTVFEVSEAKKIVDTGIPLPARDDDSHDILGTYQLVSNKTEMSKVLGSAEEFIKLLQERHRTLLSSRVGKNPGKFKEKNNRAGNTFFVDFKLVRGTLMKGFDFYKVLNDSFARAAYMMFMVSEVHPFDDGNGRIARVMMNAEFVNKSKTKIIIPTVFREDYLLTLKRLTNEDDPEPYINMLSKVHKFSERLNFENYDDLYKYLEDHNAFFESDEGKHLIVD